MPQSSAPSQISQEGGEVADGTSAKGMDWMDLMCSWICWLRGGGKPETALQKTSAPMTHSLGTMYSKVTGAGAMSHVQGASSHGRDRL